MVLDQLRTHRETLQVKVRLGEALHELFIADFLEEGFESFEQVGDVLCGYLPHASWSDEVGSRVVDWLNSHGEDTRIETLVIPARNWNEIWERSVRPVFVPPFVIKPSWIPLESDQDRIVIEIDPKMSFGTGYHESTRLALRLLQGVLRPGDRVLDAGTGTGVLAIAAAKLGAVSVLAFDSDRWSHENAIENIERNSAEKTILVELGTLEDMPHDRFDLVIANIQLNVIRDMMIGFLERLADRGQLIVSGLLQSDEDRVREMAGRHGLVLEKEAFENEWFAATLTVAGPVSN